VLTALISFYRGIARALRNPEYRLLTLFLLAIVGGGTVFYHHHEGWTWIDSIYFTVVALTTVGFGDLAPTTQLSRAVTVGFLFFGVSLLGGFISLIVRDSRRRHLADDKSEDTPEYEKA
jgi:hypothetical protein